MKNICYIAALLILLLSSGCATIICGSRQSVQFISTPGNATIFIDDVEVGKTPFSIRLKRKRDYNVVISLDGYLPYETKLTRTFNAWYLGNIVFGGIIGLIIDPITGAIYRLTPGQLHARLAQGTTFQPGKSDVYIAVSLDIDKSWHRIGQMEKQ